MNPKLFETFLAVHRPLLVARAEQITGDLDLAEDVVQTTSIYLLNHIHRFDESRATLLTWVTGAVVRRARNAVRARGDFAYAAAPEITTPGADIAYEDAQKLSLLAQMQELLKGDVTFVLAERVATGETIEHIAETLGVSGQAVSQRLAWAYKRWRRVLSRNFTRAEIETALGR